MCSDFTIYLITLCVTDGQLSLFLIELMADRICLDHVFGPELHLANHAIIKAHIDLAIKIAGVHCVPAKIDDLIFLRQLCNHLVGFIRIRQPKASTHLICHSANGSILLLKNFDSLSKIDV